MRKIFLTILSLSFCFLGQSQKKFLPQPEKKNGFGFRIGVNYSNISNTHFESKTGLYLGVFMNIQHSKFYAIQPELSYSNQGANTRYLEDENINIDYISLGLTNKFFIMKDEKFHLLIGANIDLDFDDNLINFVNNGVDDDIFFIDLAFYGGFGYQFDFGLLIEARYKHGTIEVFYQNIFDDTETHKNKLFQFGMAYKFDFKK